MLRQSANFVAVGIEIGLCVVIGIWAGIYADNHWGTTPLFFWIGLIIGFGAAIKAVVDATKKAQRMFDNENDKSGQN